MLEAVITASKDRVSHTPRSLPVARKKLLAHQHRDAAAQATKVAKRQLLCDERFSIECTHRIAFKVTQGNIFKKVQIAKWIAMACSFKRVESQSIAMSSIAANGLLQQRSRIA
ncbi:hypothetical protein [Variovorax paradoxus]|uniref:hypothetical protein n=1 Tax=Variovorax paradoxus TaxID=34073 RepID=UPI001427CF22|nr:hypothetical protein [Variovorax paradoxus]